MSDKRVKTGPVPGLTKEVYLEQIAAGETQASIGKAWNVNGHTLKYWIEKWNLKGKIAQSPVTVAAVNAPLLVAATVPAVDSDAADEILQLQKLLRNREVELAEMLDARNNWRQEAESRLQEREQALQTIDELNSERQVLLETIELSLAETAACSEAVEPPAEVDNVNHPAHYTAGKVECIDAIEAATIGLSGGQAYATGAAIKYLWRWSRKNGVEDLRKARWHIDRLIEEVGGQ